MVKIADNDSFINFESYVEYPRNIGGYVIIRFQSSH